MQNSGTENTLAKDSIAVIGQMAQSVAHIAPAVAVIFTTSLILKGAGSTAPLAILLCSLAILPSVYLHSKLQSKWAGAGGYLVLLPPAFGRFFGTAAGILDIFYEPFNTCIVILGFLGFGLEPWLQKDFNRFELFLFSQLLIFSIYFLSGRKLKIISRILFIFSLIEVTLFFILSCILLSKSNLNFNNLARIFDFSNVSFNSFGTATLFGILMFIGFESGIPFSEETKDSTRSYMKGIWFSTIITTLMFLFSFFSLTCATFNGGPLSDIKIADLASLSSPYFEKIAPAILGEQFGRTFLFIVLFFSTISCCLAAFGASARNLFAFGRLKILPVSISAVNPNNGVPTGGNKLSYIIAFFVITYFIIIDKPSVGFEFLATSFGTVTVILYLLVATAGVFNYRKLGNSNTERISILVLSIFNIIAFGYIIFGTLRDYHNKEGILYFTPWIVYATVLTSLIWSIYLNIKKPQIVDRLIDIKLR